MLFQSGEILNYFLFEVVLSTHIVNGSIQYVRLKYFSYEGILTGRLVEYNFLEVLLQFLDLLNNIILPREYYKNTMKLLFIKQFCS